MWWAVRNLRSSWEWGGGRLVFCTGGWAAGPSAAASAPSAAMSALPAGHVCIRACSGGALEVQCEVMASQSHPRSRVVGVLAHAVTLDIKASDRADEVNTALVALLRAVLGGATVSAEVIRGQRAPVKTLRVLGVGSADAAYHRLLLAKGFGR